TAGIDFLRAPIHQGFRAVYDRSACINHVVNHDAGLAPYITDNLSNLHFARFRATLGDNSDTGLQEFRHCPRTRNTTYVGRNHADVPIGHALMTEIFADKGTGIKMVYRDTEETLNLSGM